MLHIHAFRHDPARDNVIFRRTAISRQMDENVDVAGHAETSGVLVQKPEVPTCGIRLDLDRECPAAIWGRHKQVGTKSTSGSRGSDEPACRQLSCYKKNTAHPRLLAFHNHIGSSGGRIFFKIIHVISFPHGAVGEFFSRQERVYRFPSERPSTSLDRSFNTFEPVLSGIEAKEWAKAMGMTASLYNAVPIRSNNANVSGKRG